MPELSPFQRQKNLPSPVLECFFCIVKSSVVGCKRDMKKRGRSAALVFFIRLRYVFARDRRD